MPDQDGGFLGGAKSFWNVVKDVSEWGMQVTSTATRGAYHALTEKSLYERIGNHDSSMDAFNLLKAAATVERQQFYCMLYNTKTHPANPDAESMMIEFATVGGHSVANAARGFVGVPYGEIVYDVYGALKDNKRLKLRNISDNQPNFRETKEYRLYKEMEAAIIEALFNSLIENMTPEQRRKLEEELEKIASQYGESYKAVGGLGAAWALGGMAGFLPYLAASTVVGAITGALGLTLPFAFYTTMSSGLSLLLGPPGALLLGGILTYQLGSPNLEKTIKLVPMIYCIRKRLETGRSI